jgi:hypothetical protein
VPDLHGWITQQIDRSEQRARACTATDWRHVFDGVIVDRDTDGWQSAPDNARIASVANERIYWSTNPPHSPDADHIVCNDPDTVLRRCAADRKILTIHQPQGGNYPGHYACEGCGYDGADYCSEPLTEHVNDCPTLLAVAEAYGLTEEQRAALDRPEVERPKRTGPSLIPDALAEAMREQLLVTVLGMRPVEPRPEVKALEILAPELKKIPGYVPIAEN